MIVLADLCALMLVRFCGKYAWLELSVFGEAMLCEGVRALLCWVYSMRAFVKVCLAIEGGLLVVQKR